MNEPQRFAHAIELIDSANALDPNRVMIDGREFPAELMYSHRMTAWLHKMNPAASEALRLAVRCQHLRRWVIPRSQYPMTRPGYHQWRTRLAQHHAEKAAELLQQAGYEEATIGRVQSLIRKERLKTDAEAQILEDVACLVFLEDDYVDFARRHEAEKVIDILKKTWRKMSDSGHAAALELAKTLPEAELKLVQQAIS